MPRRLYELCGADERLRFSPFCWRVIMALVHKQLPFESVPWHFCEKDALAFSGQEPPQARKVPVLEDEDGTVVSDSLEIMKYLDRTYPEHPLIGTGQARARLDFIRHWSETQLAPAIMTCVIADVHDVLTPEDQAYFRESREARLGNRLEEVQDLEAGKERLHQALSPLRALLADSPFIDGEGPGAGDYLAFGMLMWGHITGRHVLLDEDDTVQAWFERLLARADKAGIEHVRAADINGYVTG
ncbi:glutathione S-transferase N-terminal domain-containing protein [Larsenimonas rhizosphaerae]|uniref:Glutathione S-transferase N-terminal domain-containing protein n=1 Tax=Larsenimonas rhizosphaerae TaxID=2944682 RepID=A0AA41ZJ19_9GAMM|nr:glutathione S-transferase N-terminal domain-containing protein [Larsenimonas rhizosphaerae]MCM2129957.1 glutathione S-transferase N-terminal domain-containing protein [Larsenimonas rhizosphaerae]MCX2522656.1 glutathione S-transferase N-terminal domain-containing protein [Larsenimonas rhizosphaerae]